MTTWLASNPARWLRAVVHTLVVLSLLLGPVSLVRATPGSQPTSKGMARLPVPGQAEADRVPPREAGSLLAPSLPLTATATLAPAVTDTFTPTVSPTPVVTATFTPTATATPTVTTALTPTATPAPQPALSLAKEAGAATAEPGEVITFTLIVSNAGPGPAQGMVVRDRLPPGLTYLPGSGGEGSYEPAAGTVSWALPGLEAGQSWRRSLAARVAAGPGERLVNLAHLAGEEGRVLTATAEVEVAFPAAAGWAAVSPQHGGVLRSADGRVEVRFPSGAVSRPAEARHRGLAPVDLASDRRIFYRFELLAREAAQPAVAVMAFARPVTVTLVYSDTEVEGVIEEDLRLAYWDEEGGAWIPVPATVDTAGNRVTALLSHFSQYGMVGEDEAFFLPRIEAGQVNLFSGDSSYRFDLETPAGAGGLKVPLSLRYSGGTANSMYGVDTTDGGWVGVGWTLDLGSIEGETLALNGVSDTLVEQTATQTGSVQWGSWQAGLWRSEYRTQDESFLRIERVGREWKHPFGCWEGSKAREAYVENDAYYRVWDKSGTYYEFGKGDYDAGPPGGAWWSWPGSAAGLGNSGRALSIRTLSNGASTRYAYSSFYLEQIRDPQGNAVEIDYISHASSREYTGGNCPVFDGYRWSWKETYPSEIRYTVNPAQGDNQAEYRVLFDVEAKAFDTKSGKFVAQTGYILKGVRVEYHPASGAAVVMGEYRFDYKVINTAGSKEYRLKQIDQYGKGGLAGGQKLPAVTFGYTAPRPIAYAGVEYSRPFLATVNNGYGGSLTFAYSHWCYPSSPCGGLVNDLMKQVVESETIGAGLGSSAVHRYSYSEAGLEEKEGFHALVGFGRVAATIDGDDRRTVTEFDNTAEEGEPASGDSEDEYKGKVLETRVEDLGGTVYAWTTTAYADGRLSDWAEGVHFVYAQEVVKAQCAGADLCQEQTTTYEYTPSGGRQYGNLTAVWEYDGSDQLYRRTVRQYNVRDGGQEQPRSDVYIVDRVSSEAVYAGGNWTESRATWYYYDGNSSHLAALGAEGELTRVQRLLGRNELSGWVYWDTSEEEYVYDGFGNVTEERVYAGYGKLKQQIGNWANIVRVDWPSGSRTTTTAYYSGGAFAQSITNPAEHQTIMEYYGVNGVAANYGLPGQVKKVTDANGVWTQSRYDLFGRLTQQKRSGDGSGWTQADVSLYRQYLNVGTPGLQRVTSWVGRNDHWEEQYYDGLGRPIQSHRQKEGTTEVRMTQSYDAAGRVEKECWRPRSLITDWPN